EADRHRRVGPAEQVGGRGAGPLDGGGGQVDVQAAGGGAGAVAGHVGGGAGDALARALGRDHHVTGAGGDAGQSVGAGEADGHRLHVPAGSVGQLDRRAADAGGGHVDPHRPLAGGGAVAGPVDGGAGHDGAGGL